MAFALAVGALLLGVTARPAAAACPAPTTVGSFEELDAAIVAFNAATAPCAAVISLSANIGLPSPPSQFLTFSLTIHNATPGVTLEIDGNGKLVDGNGTPLISVHPFRIGVSTTVTMNDLTVTGGNVRGFTPDDWGGGILNFGNLTLNRCTVTGNKVQDRGGGIANEGGQVEIVESTISRNQSSGGGGIYHEGNGATLTIRNSTIATNDAPNGVGAGIEFLNAGSLTLDSVTITDNFSDGIDLSRAGGTVVTIRNTILADSVGLDDCVAGTGVNASTFVDQGHNFVGTQRHCNFVDGMNGNIVAQGSAKLSPLADNGGPTQTNAPKLDSPVLNAGDTDLGTDQRGVARPIGAADEIGAHESSICDGATSWVVNGFAELEAAIACFNAKTTPGVYTLTFSTSAQAGQSTLPIHNPTAGVSLVIEGQNHSIEVGSLIMENRALEIKADTTVTINDLRLAEGNVLSAPGGGGLLNAGTVTLNRCRIEDNTSTGPGGGISNSGAMVIDESLISDNRFTGSDPDSGGGVFNSGTLTIRNSTISRNASTPRGGGIGNSGTLALDSVTVTANTVSGSDPKGAGLFTHVPGTVTVRNSILAGNTGAADCEDLAPALTSDGHNLVQTQSGCPFVDGVDGDVVGHDPMLDGLHDNGGPTRTHALKPGSPARDAGDTTLAADQREVPRPGGPAKDIGAYEDQQTAKLTIVKELDMRDDTDFAFTVTGDPLGPTPLMFLLDQTNNDDDNVPRSRTFDVPAGSYVVQETPPPGYIAEAIDCVGATSATPDLATATATLTVQPDQHVTCVFHNTPGTTTTSSTTTSSTTVLPTTTSLAPATTTTSTTVGTTTSTTLVTGDSICVGGGMFERAIVTLGKLRGAAGDETFRITATLALPADVGGAFDPASRGLQILLEDLGGTSSLLDLTAEGTPVPPGGPGAHCDATSGWRRRTYHNRSDSLPPGCALGSAQGLRKVRVKYRRRGERIAIAAKGRGATLAAPAGRVRLTIVLGADHAAGLAGACASRVFETIECKTKGAVVRCR